MKFSFFSGNLMVILIKTLTTPIFTGIVLFFYNKNFSPQNNLKDAKIT